MKRKVILGLVVVLIPLVNIIGYSYYRTAQNRKQQVAQTQTAQAEVVPTVITPSGLIDELNSRREIPIKIDERLNTSAQQKCDDMSQNDYFGHISPTNYNGPEYAKKAMQNAKGTFGENLIGNVPVTDTSKDIYNAWFTSPGHKAAALEKRYGLTGYGICSEKDGERSIVQHFYGSEIF